MTIGTEFAAMMDEQEKGVAPELPLQKLVGVGKTGDAVLNHQELASKQGFKHVAKHWYNTGTMSYEAGLELIAKGKSQTEDITATVHEMLPSVNNNGEFVMKYKDGREFRPTEHAIMQMGNWAGTGTWYVTSLLSNPEDLKGRQLYARDRGDAETLATVLKNGFRRVHQKGKDKPFFWRTRKDGTLRAMLTDRFAVVDNEWFVNALRTLIPGGRLSHFKEFGDSDTIYGNVLIPDTIREEKDSDYGGMLSVGNSEIGERRVSSLPSVFRAICMNGCIWDQVKGKGIKQVHRGKINLEKLFLEIKENLNKQIPLLPQGIDRLLGTRTYVWDGASVLPLIAEFATENRLGKKAATSVLEAYRV
jgi:hypothetical protein